MTCCGSSMFIVKRNMIYVLNINIKFGAGMCLREPKHSATNGKADFPALKYSSHNDDIYQDINQAFARFCAPLRIPASARRCAPLCAFARLCAPLRASARLCAPLLAFVRLCAPLRASARLCAPLHAFVRLCALLCVPLRASARLCAPDDRS